MDGMCVGDIYWSLPEMCIGSVEEVCGYSAPTVPTWSSIRFHGTRTPSSWNELADAIKSSGLFFVLWNLQKLESSIHGPALLAPSLSGLANE